MNSAPAIGTELAPDAVDLASWVARMLQAGDTFYPTGSYAHSFGLEGLVQAGVVHDRASLRSFLQQSVLPSLRQVELPLTAHAWQAFAAADWAMLADLATLSSALRTAREARVASENIGRQRAELVAALHSSALAIEYVARVQREGWPHSAALSAALEGRVWGAPLPAVLAGVVYASLAATLSAAMKLLRIGQNSAQSLLTEMLAATPDLIRQALVVPRDEIGWFNPWLDIAAARHETADARMFIS